MYVMVVDGQRPSQAELRAGKGHREGDSLLPAGGDSVPGAGGGYRVPRFGKAGIKVWALTVSFCESACETARP